MFFVSVKQPPAAIAQQVAARAWGRVLASFDDRIAELQHQREAHLAQRMHWLNEVSAEWDAAPAIAIAKQCVLWAHCNMLDALDSRIAELQHQREAHLAQGMHWLKPAGAESDPAQPRA